MRRIIALMCLLLTVFLSACYIERTESTYDSNGNRISRKSSSVSRPYVMVRGTLGIYKEVGEAAKQAGISGEPVKIKTDKGIVYAEPTGQKVEKHTVRDFDSNDATVLYDCEIIQLSYARPDGKEETSALFCP